MNVTQMTTSIFRDAIIYGNFKPGARLVEKELCELSGVSRTIVREALRTLEAEELVINVPQRGPEVVTIDEQLAKEIYDFRALLEPEIVRLFIDRSTAADRQRLSVKLKEIDEAIRTGQVNEANIAKKEFYAILVEVADSSLIASSMRRVFSLISILRNVTMSRSSRVEEAANEIGAMGKAILSQDKERACRLCLLHIVKAREEALKYFG